MSIRKYRSIGVSSAALALLSVISCGGVPAEGNEVAPTAPASPKGDTQGRQQLTGHLAPHMTSAAKVRRVPGNEKLTLTIGLPVHDSQALTDLVADVTNPEHPSYRKYLTPTEFGARFGASAADYEAVLAWARSKGLTVEAHENRLVAHVTGNVTDLEGALDVQFHYAMRPDGTEFRVADREPSLDLRVPVLHISNLDNFQLPKRQEGGGSGWAGARTGNDFRHAYAAGSALTGAGQTIGIVMGDGVVQSDVTGYAAANGLTFAHPNVTVVPSTVATGGPGTENTLDVEMALSMAPAARIVLFAGNWDQQLANMAANSYIKQFSSSYTGVADANVANLMAQLAVQGQSFFQASGDSGAYTQLNGPSTNYSEIRQMPYITLVGGTALTMNNGGASFASETSWSQSCGGILQFSSPGISLPSYQLGIATAANQASTVYRNSPDVSAEGSNVEIYVGGGATLVGGTSAATPLWAGFMALANEQAVQYNLPSVGFANPALYQVARSTSYANDFHDVTTGSNPCSAGTGACLLNGSAASYNATSGYDLVTGLGSPQAALINALARPASGVVDWQSGLVSKQTLTAQQSMVWGTDSNGMPLYVCRATAPDGSLQVGKIRSDWNYCDVAYGTGEIGAQTYLQTLYPNWVAGSSGSIPPYSRAFGTDTDGSPLFACSANYTSPTSGIQTVQLGKMKSTFLGCTFPAGGAEHTVTNYKVLTTTSGTVQYQWQAATVGQALPANAIAGGIDADGQTLYPCATNMMGGSSLEIGKTKAGFLACDISYGGREYLSSSANTFFVLVPSPVAATTSVQQDAFMAGTESNGAPLGVCQANYGGLQIGKFNANANTCQFGYGGHAVTYTPANGFSILGGLLQ